MVISPQVFPTLLVTLDRDPPHPPDSPFSICFPSVAVLLFWPLSTSSYLLQTFFFDRSSSQLNQLFQRVHISCSGQKNKQQIMMSLISIDLHIICWGIISIFYWKKNQITICTSNKKKNPYQGCEEVEYWAFAIKFGSKLAPELQAALTKIVIAKSRNM